MKLSVVVPTFHRRKLLIRCLYSLIHQDYPSQDFEIIVVDDAADIRTEEVVKKMRLGRLFPRVRYLAATDTQGPAAARNIGWQRAYGDIIAFTDDDCVPAHDWLRNGSAAFGKDVAAVSGRILVPLKPAPTDYERCVSWLERAQFATANCFYRRGILEEVGGFDERFTSAWREDADLFFTLISRGFVAGFSKEASVTHPVRRARWGISVLEQHKSRFNALLYKKHPELYRQMIERSPPWHYYFTLGALAVALAGLWLGSAFLGWLGTAGWLYCLTCFIHRRLHDCTRSWRHVSEMFVTSLLIPFLSIYWRLHGAVTYRIFFL